MDMGKPLGYLCVAILLMAASCTQDTGRDPERQSDNINSLHGAFTIDDARMFFAEYGPLLRLDGMGGGGTRSMALEDLPRLLWDSARYSTILGMEVIEVPFEGLRCNISAEQAQPHTRAAGEPAAAQEPDTGDNGAFNSIVRLLSGLDDNGEIWYASAYATASDEYLRRTGGWETFDMGDIPDDFCGTIMFSRIDGTFIGGNIFEEGALTGNVLPVDGAWDDWWDDDCDTTTEVWEVCYTTSISGAGLPTVSFTECKETNRLTKRNCPDVGLIVPSKPGLDISKPDVAQSLFDNTTLSPDQWKELVKTLERIKSTCMGKEMYNVLLKAGKMDFVFDPGNNEYEGKYEHADKKMTIKTLSDDEVVFHEMFHRYQHIKYGSRYNPGYTNIEIEARMAQYMYFKRKNSNKGINAHSWGKMPGVDQDIRQVGDMLDSTGNLLPGEDIGSLNKLINKIGADLKRDYPAYANTHFQNLPGPANFSVMKQLMESGGC